MGDESTRTREERQRENVRGKVARAAARFAPLFGALTVSLMAGCTAVLELDRNQCAVDADCTDLFPGSTLVCNNKVCEAPSCATDQECKARGGAFATSICSPSFQCVPGECTDNSECSPGVCNVAQNRCVDRECQTTQECLNKAETKTVQCIEGFCVDPMWGCIGKPDDRTVVPGEKGTLRIPLLSANDNTPIAGATWKIEVCPPTDPACSMPIVTQDKVGYDPATGIATVPGIPYNVPFRVKIDEIGFPPYVPTDPTEQGGPQIMPMDFYTQQPIVGEMTVPALRVVSRQGLNELIKLFKGITNPGADPTKPTVDGELGNIYGLAFDCQGNPAAEVSLNYFDALSQPLAPTVLYFDNGLPVLTAKWSFPSGIFSTLNLPLMPINVQTSLVLESGFTMPAPPLPPLPEIKRSRVIRSGYSLVLLPARMATVHFHPRMYY